MLDTVHSREDATTRAPIGFGDVARSLVALAILLAIFLSFEPFRDLADPTVADLTTGNETLSSLCLIFLALVAALLVAPHARLLVQAFKRVPYLLLLVSLLLSVVLSVDPGTSARRLALASTTFVLAAVLPWLTTGMRQFTTFLVFTLATVLALSFLGVLIVPELTIHQPTDLVEPEIAGDWRGVYVHKNITASLMAIFIYVGWFVARAERPRIGVAIAVAAFVFLVFTHGKSAFGLFFAAGLAAFAVDRARSLPLKFVIALGPLVLLNMITVGSATNDALHAAVAALPIDATFTGRTDIWRFAMDAIRDNFWTGRGFEAFWYTASLRSGDDNTMRWMGDIANSHNSYVDLALTIGVPGLALVIVAFVFMPLKDFHNTLAAQANREFARLFLVLWLFTLYCGTFEVFFLSRANPMWFVMALAVCGLRYTSRYEIRQ